MKNKKSNWLNNHVRDIYVRKAKENNYRSRAAFKLKEINQKFNILKNNFKVLDIGCNPGGWSQVCLENKCKVWGVDILNMSPIENVNFTILNITNNQGKDLVNYYNELKIIPFDLLISDAACNTTGNVMVDHCQTIELNRIILNNVNCLLKKGGNFIFKTFNGEETHDLLQETKKLFNKVHTFKPNSSRSNSREIYIIALDLRIEV